MTLSIWLAFSHARVLASLREPPHISWLNRTFGSLFVGAALLLATFRRST